MKVHIETVHFSADQKLVDYIEKKLGKLDNFFDRILDARVSLKLENAGQVKDKIVEVRLSVPGDLLVAKDTEQTFEAAVDKTADALKRQLIKYKERMREFI
ncbi:MAG: ribosome-associated translation inhibitor RaiA [Lewinella sp.]|nr:ribosome-associated translation inhibitor RaiA [Lewinella sp.]